MALLGTCNHIVTESLCTGVSAAQSLDVNSLAVPRAAKEAIGGIARLTHGSGRAMTINVEYNQLDPLLRATGHPDGDVADASGFSPYPGGSARERRLQSCFLCGPKCCGGGRARAGGW